MARRYILARKAKNPGGSPGKMPSGRANVPTPEPEKSQARQACTTGVANPGRLLKPCAFNRAGTATMGADRCKPRLLPNLRRVAVVGRRGHGRHSNVDASCRSAKAGIVPLVGGSEGSDTYRTCGLLRSRRRDRGSRRKLAISTP